MSGHNAGRRSYCYERDVHVLRRVPCQNGPQHCEKYVHKKRHFSLEGMSTGQMYAGLDPGHFGAEADPCRQWGAEPKVEGEVHTVND